MGKIRWAVMGAGGIARRRTIPEGILPADNAELVAVYSPQTGADVGRQFGVPWAESEEALFDFDFDALYVASPVACHCRQVEQAAAAGRHVFCEKPLAMNVAEAERMIAACARANVTLGVGFMMRFHPLHERMAAVVRSGELGTPVFARAQLSCSYPPAKGAWRQDPDQGGGGALPDLAPHCFDLLEMILRQAVSSVTCRKANLVHHYPVEDTAITLVEFSGGTLATVDCLFNVPDKTVRNRLEIYGSKGSLLAEETIGQVQTGRLSFLSSDGPEQPLSMPQRRSLAAEATESAVVEGNLYRAEIEDFGVAVAQGREPAASGAQGLWIQRVLAACDQSADVGAAVRVYDDSP